MTTLTDVSAVASAVRDAVADVTITDVHTHLFPPSHGDLLLWGVDELLTYHYLVAELFTIAPRGLTYEKFWKMSRREQADAIWEHVFLRHGALSEAARGVVTALNALGLDVAGRDLDSIRNWFDKQNAEEYLHKVFELAGLDYAVMTNNPFVREEAACWRRSRNHVSASPGRSMAPEDCLKAALRIDTLILDWPAAAEAMSDAGYDATADPDESGFAAARKFLADWAARLKPVYIAASLPPEFRYPSDDVSGRVMEKVIIPSARELGLPMAMMIGVRKGVNPSLRDGGDAVGVAGAGSVCNLCSAYPDAKFLVTMLSRVDQHELCVCARKFGNLHVFGCWWFCNNPSIIEEMTRMRLELLGATFTCQHSDARVLDQLIYKWSHTRRTVAEVLVDKHRLLFEAGWRPSVDEIRRDVRALFGGAFDEFLAK